MSISNQVFSNNNVLNGEILEKVIIGNDLSSLNSFEKVQYVKNVCQTIGLNPVTKPIQLIKFQGKEIPYFTKDASEQLRKINKVSINKLEKQIVEPGVYIVTAYASLPDGRQDSSTGAINTKGLNGDALSNAFMKAETKAKRRVTLSICGLGFMDESEIESMPNAQKIDIMNEKNISKIEVISTNEVHNIEKDIIDMSWSENFEDLQKIYKEAYKYYSKVKDQESLQKLMKAKDERKIEIEKKQQESETVIDNDTGEIKQ